MPSTPAPKIVVIGSINMDLVCRTPAMPSPGQTILGTTFLTIPGGKGANQAVAAAKLGAQVYMVGRVGNDDFGQRLLNGLNQHNVHTRHVTITEGVSTGVACITVDRKGENAIVVVPGANHALTDRDIDAAEEIIDAASVVVLQLEIPLPFVAHVLDICRRRHIHTILDPAPVPPAGLPRKLYNVDLLTPNQSEGELLLGQPRTHHVTSSKIPDPKQIAMDLLSRGPRTIVLKLGNKGSLFIGREGNIEHVKPFKVKIVDTTAAGDAFTAALAVAHSRNMDLPTAARFANAAGALACSAFGAQPALPTLADVEQLLTRRRD